MNYRLPDEEYAVLDYIRNRKGTHIDHLNIMFGHAAEPAVKNLEKFGLINHDFPNEQIYFATVLGKEYKQPFSIWEKYQKLKPVYKALCVIGSVIVCLSAVVSAVFAVLQYFHQAP